MNDWRDNAPVCLSRCDRLDKYATGPLGYWRCGVSGDDWISHAKRHDCPLGKFEGQTPVADPVALTIGGVLHGAAGIAKALTGTGGADDEMVKARTDICGGCEHGERDALGLFHRCKLCGCATWAKVRNVGEKCPAGKW